jgi:hypothetical protein
VSAAIAAVAATIAIGRSTAIVRGFHAVARARPITVWLAASATAARAKAIAISQPSRRGAAPSGSVRRASSARGCQAASVARTSTASASASGAPSAKPKPAATATRAAPSTWVTPSWIAAAPTAQPAATSDGANQARARRARPGLAGSGGADIGWVGHA